MNTELLLHSHRRHVPDIEDLAIDYLEEEVGRHHWQKNWPAFKARLGEEGVRARIKAWHEGLNIYDEPFTVRRPEEALSAKIAAYLDAMVTGRSGKWL